MPRECSTLFGMPSMSAPSAATASCQFMVCDDPCCCITCLEIAIFVYVFACVCLSVSICLCPSVCLSVSLFVRVPKAGLGTGNSACNRASDQFVQAAERVRHAPEAACGFGAAAAEGAAHGHRCWPIHAAASAGHLTTPKLPCPFLMPCPFV